VILGAKIRTMWMTPFYLYIGTLFIYLFQNQIDTGRLKVFNYVFIFLFLFSPFLYGYISITQKDKRTDYKGEQMARAIESKLKKLGFPNTFLIYGDEWIAGNLCYHLKSKPKCKISPYKITLWANNSKGIYRVYYLEELVSKVQK